MQVRGADPAQETPENVAPTMGLGTEISVGVKLPDASDPSSAPDTSWPPTMLTSDPTTTHDRAPAHDRPVNCTNELVTGPPRS